MRGADPSPGQRRLVTELKSGRARVALRPGARLHTAFVVDGGTGIARATRAAVAPTSGGPGVLRTLRTLRPGASPMAASLASTWPRVSPVATAICSRVQCFNAMPRSVSLRASGMTAGLPMGQPLRGSCMRSARPMTLFLLTPRRRAMAAVERRGTCVQSCRRRSLSSGLQR